MSSATYRDRLNRWRPTLPEPKRVSAASRGPGLGGLVQMICSWTMLLLLVVLFFFGRSIRDALGFPQFASLFLLLLVPITGLTIVAWRVARRIARAELTGERG